jgi:hypothetical protein
MTAPIVPVYLNQRLVFDLVAMLQGGISTVSRLEVTVSDSTKEKTDLAAKFSLADAFGSLLRIDLGGSKVNEKSGEQKRTTSSERTHTPASLFAALRDELQERSAVVNPEQQVPQPGDFIEFKAAMRRNPLIEGLDQVTQMLSLADVFSAPVSQTSQKVKGKSPPAESELATLAKQLKQVAQTLKEGTTRDLFATEIAGGYSAVVTAEIGFLNDVAMSDLIDGTFSVLGKVIRAIPADGRKISLVRNSSVSMSPRLLAELVQSFKNLQSIPGFSTPDMTYEIEGPAIQVLPIAIFS